MYVYILVAADLKFWNHMVYEERVQLAPVDLAVQQNLSYIHTYLHFQSRDQGLHVYIHTQLYLNVHTVRTNVSVGPIYT